MKIKIGVIGSAEPNEKLNKLAEEVGIEIAKKDCFVVCGGLGGVMEAACKGAKSIGGTTIGILPGEDKKQANNYVDINIVTGMGYSRNMVVVLSSDAVIAIGGSYGTLSEISYALKFNIPLIGINTWDVSPKINKTSSPIQAVELAYSLAKL